MSDLEVPNYCLLGGGKAPTTTGPAMNTVLGCIDASTPPSLSVSLLKDDVFSGTKIISASCVPLLVVVGNVATAVEVHFVFTWVVG
jgi:hypothetical protein